MTKHPENKYQRVLSEKNKRSPKGSEKRDKSGKATHAGKRIKEALRERETQDDLNTLLRTGHLEG